MKNKQYIGYGRNLSQKAVHIEHGLSDNEAEALAGHLWRHHTKTWNYATNNLKEAISDAVKLVMSRRIDRFTETYKKDLAKPLDSLLRD